MLITSCGPSQEQTAAVTDLEEEVAALKKAKTKLETDLNTLREDAEKRQSDILKRNEELMKKNDELEGQFEQLQDEAAKAKKELQDYMSKYKLGARGKLKGLQIPKLDTAENGSFVAVVVREVTPTEISFQHSNGISRIPLAKAPADIQKKCLYDPDEIKALEETEKATKEATEGLAEIGDEVKMKDPTKVVNPIVVNNLKNRIGSRRQQIEKINKEIKQVQQSAFGDSAIGKYRVQILKQRAQRLSNDIKVLVNMLNKELNG